MHPMHVVLFVFIALILIAGFSAQYVMHRRGVARMEGLAKVHCQVCDGPEITERGLGSYSCADCGFDTDMPYEGRQAEIVAHIQDLSMGYAVLGGAAREFHQSKRREERDSDGNRKTVGPFPAHHAEGLEQVFEVCGIADKFDDLLAEPVAVHRERIADTLSLEYNECAERAIEHTVTFGKDLRKLRDALREEFRGSKG